MFYSIGVSYLYKLPSNIDFLEYLIVNDYGKDILIDKTYIENFNSYLKSNNKQSYSYVTIRKNLSDLTGSDFLLKVSRATYRINNNIITKKENDETNNRL